MQLGTSTLLSIALGALLIAAPGLDKVGGGVSYDQAFAAKGGNGKGNGGGNGNAGGNSSSSSSSAGGNSAKSGKAKSDDATDGTSLASLTGSGKKTKGLDHPSSLGRWNATKNFEHPSIQAHVRNGKFNGTIGMLARFGLALNTLGEMQASAAAAETASAELAALLQGLGLGTVAPTDPAVDPTLDPTVDPTLDPTAVFDLDLAISQFKAAPPLTDQATLDNINALIGTVESAPSVEDLAAAQGELLAAEDMMAEASNRASWETVRSVVIGRLGLQDVTVTEPTTPTDPAAPATPSDPAPVIDPAL